MFHLDKGKKWYVLEEILWLISGSSLKIRDVSHVYNISTVRDQKQFHIVRNSIDVNVFSCLEEKYFYYFCPTYYCY